MQQSADRELVRLLQQADRDAQRRLRAIRGKTNIGAKVEQAQLRESRAAILEVMSVLWDTLGDKVKARRLEAAATALRQSWDWDEVLLARAYPSASERAAMRRYLQQTASKNVEAAVARQAGRSIPLSERVYRSKELTAGIVDRQIGSALARGISWGQFANEVRTSIRPDTPGGVAFAAKRLARTEINNAYHAMSAAYNEDKPWNTGMVWKTSRSHPNPDICDLYEDRSPYPVGEVPSKPHPQCLCYTYPETVTPEVFIQQFRSGEYDFYIQNTYGRAA